ncbi:MAG: DUF1566 domain-containing protein [Flavobacteriales bacterium]|jgi:hypothetical protein|nr:DUF1566 domain-containing protein [Flavobacteriales bacterium]
MKALLACLLLISLSFGTLLAQTPQAFNYQGVARDAGGDAVVNTAIGVEFQLHQTSAGGMVVYSETHTSTTNEHGLFSMEVGNGTPTTGTFANIDWSAGPYFLEVGLDPVGGSSYTSMGTQQLQSVPYALHAGSAETADTDWTETASEVYTLKDVGIGTSSPQALLDLRNGTSSEMRASLSNDHWAKFQFTDSEGLRIEAKNTGVEFRPVLLIGKELRFFSGAGTTPERMRISSSGNVGVGTDAPAAKLHTRINSAPGASLLARTGLFLDNQAQNGTFPNNPNEVALVFGENGVAKQAILGATYANDHLRFYTGSEFNAAKVSIDHDGRVGIGTESPSARLDVVGSFQLQDGTQSAGRVLTSDANGNASWSNAASLPSGTQAGEMLYWDGTGWVVIPAGPPAQYGPAAPTLRYCNGVPTWGACTVPLGAIVNGGIVFYVDGTGEHGLIAKLTNDADDFWGCSSFSTTTSANVGEGANNRSNYQLARLQAEQAAQAAYIAAQAQVNQCCTSSMQTIVNGTCSGCGPAPVFNDPCPSGDGAIGQTGDWYMPSSGELNLMYTNLHQNGLGNFSAQSYWSSTQASQTQGAAVSFSNGNNFNAVKSANYRVRRIKAF